MRLLVLFLALTVLATGTWLGLRPHPVRALSDLQASPTASGEREPVGSGSDSSSTLRQPVSEAGFELRIRVVGVSGAPGVGVAYVERYSRRDLGQEFTPLSRSTGPWLLVDPPSAGTESYVIERQAGAWAWVAVFQVGSSGFLRYLLVPPATSHRERTVHLADTSHGVHVFVDGPHRAQPVSVRLLHRDLKAPSEPTEIHRASFTSPGYQEFQPVPPGMVFACIDGARPRDAIPHVARVVVGGSGRQDKVVRLVGRRPRGTIRLEVTLTEIPDARLTPAIYLRGESEAGTEFVPLMSRFKKGRNQMVSVEVPEGRYRLCGMPLGIFGDSLPRDTYSVFRDQNLKIRCNLAVPDSASVSLTISGVSTNLRPFSVLQRDPSALSCLPEAPSLIGPYRWRVPHSDVPAISREAILEVRAHGAFFLSRKPVSFRSGDSLSVDAERAGCVDLIITNPSIIAKSGVCATLQSTLGAEKIRLVSRWHRRLGPFERLLHARFVVPIGSAGVTVTDAEGTILHHESLRIGTAVHQVLVQ